MIPLTAAIDLSKGIAAQPSLTYKMRTEELSICGNTDGLDAVRQSIFKILQTERYKYLIYSGNYGIELEDLFGEPVSYVCPELERRITEALLWDERIESVTNFHFDFPKKGVVHVTFEVGSVFGNVSGEKEVNY